MTSPVDGTRRGRAGVTIAALAAALAAPVLLPYPVAAAETTTGPAVRWSVSPSGPEGPDGRTAIEHTLDPGESVDDRIAVRNVSEEDITFGLAAADGFFTRSGRFDVLASGQESVAAGRWIDVADSVFVPAGETVVVPFTVEVPDDAEPGDRAAGLTASVVSVQSAEDGTAVGVESRVGVRVLTRVSGEIAPAAEVTGISAAYDLSWNPFSPGEVRVGFTAVNRGNTRLLIQGEVESAGRGTGFPAEGDIQQELLPGDERELTAVVDGVWPLFLLPTSIDVQADVLTIDGSEPRTLPVSADVTIWAVPWPQLITLLIVSAIVAAVVRLRNRSRRRLAAMLSSAREEGRRDAEAIPPR